MFVPVVAASGCLFRGVWGSCAKCEGTFAAFSLVLFPVWHLLIVIDGGASSDRSLGLMLVWVHLGLFMGCRRMCSLHCVCVCDARCMHCVGVISGIFSLFLLCGDRKKRLSYVFYHNILESPIGIRYDFDPDSALLVCSKRFPIGYINFDWLDGMYVMKKFSVAGYVT